MSVVGYARVSTDHQSLEAQHGALMSAGCERIFTDKLSGVRDDRAGLLAPLDYVRAGDTVVIVALDRLGRSGTQAGRLGSATPKRARCAPSDPAASR